MSVEPESKVVQMRRALETLKDERERMAKAYAGSIPGQIQLEAYDRTIASAEQRISEMGDQA